MNSMTKSQWRQMMKQCKAALPQTERQAQSDSVMTRLEQIPVWQRANHILTYWSLPDELDTHLAVHRWLEQGKTVYLPRVKGDDLDIVRYDGTNLDDHNRFHIGEPMGEAVDVALLQLIVVPAVAFDQQRNRLGRGKGYYDRLLAQCSCVTLGVGYDCQLVDHLPTEAHDQPLDAVLTAGHSLICDSDKQHLFL